VVQSAILVLIVTAPAIGKPGPSHAVVLGSPIFELFVGVAATGVAAVVWGLRVRLWRGPAIRSSCCWR
jgi:hypothetical protein